ncbi:hypothetical protein EVG20_g4524 [Dentipellis fragilis]|uniref:Uncharacterized protein n=1 Tax=Dentipellis fragilis TaxID=205917 RepID=A0A4Y9YVG6_9AGAM|nr:hypothetical protein EVG20_g4524 [Dentipellis fragilis]
MEQRQTRNRSPDGSSYDSRKRRKLEKVPNWSPEPPDNAWTEVAHKLKWRTIVQTQIDIDAGCTAVQTDEDAASIAVGAAKIFKAVRDAIHPSLEEIVEMYRRPEDR